MVCKTDKVRISPKHGKTPGRIELEYYDDDDLTQIARTLLAVATAMIK